jgi:hypothetical protein
MIIAPETITILRVVTIAERGALTGIRRRRNRLEDVVSKCIVSGLNELLVNRCPLTRWFIMPMALGVPNQPS